MTLLNLIGTQELIILLIVAVFLFVIPIWALVDIVKSKFEANMQLIWVVIVVFLSFIGAILYFAIGQNQKVKQKDLAAED